MPTTTPALGELDTFPKLLLHNAANWSGCRGDAGEGLGIWHEVTWRQYSERVREVALGLHGLGFRHGEVLGLIGRNRPNWVWSELAGQALGGRRSASTPTCWRRRPAIFWPMPRPASS